MKELQQSLEAVGLTDKEATIYISILRSGKASLSEIAEHSNIRRTTIYQHLDTLLKRGFVSKTIKGKRTMYLPEDPAKILKTFDRNRTLFLEQTPHIQQLYEKARHKPNVRVYEGQAGILQILDEIGSSLLPIDAFFSPEKFFRVVPRPKSNDFLKAIEKNENVLRDLVERDSLSESFIKEVRSSQSTFHKVKALPQDFSAPVDVLVTGDKVAIISFDNLTGLIVENAEVAAFHRSTHHFFWKNLP